MHLSTTVCFHNIHIIIIVAFIPQKYEECNCHFLIGEMSRHDIHENEKNSVGWCTVSKRTQDRPWRVSDESCMVSYCYVTSMFQVEASKLLSSVNCNLETRNNPEEQIRRANNYFLLWFIRKNGSGYVENFKNTPIRNSCTLTPRAIIAFFKASMNYLKTIVLFILTPLILFIECL